MPVGVLWLLRAQVAVVYVFAGIAKLHGDWLVHALPLRLWLPALDGLGPFDGLLDQRWTAHALALAGALFDCTIVALLLWRRTRLDRLRRRGRLPRGDLAALPDRRVPVADDRRRHPVLRARTGPA